MRLFSSAVKFVKRIVNPAAGKEPVVYIYDWGAWNRALFRAIFTSSIRIKAEVSQKNKYILSRVKRPGGYFLFHIDLTETGAFYADKEALCDQLRSRNIICLNKDVTNISKNFVQDTCLQLGLNSTRAFQDGDPNELLIIKSNDNFGGVSESRLTKRQKIKLGMSTDGLSADLAYTVTERRNVEPGIWNDGIHIIERYISNTNNLYYRIYKVGSRFAISEASETGLIKKMPDGIKRLNYFFDALAEESNNTVRADMSELYTILNKFCTHIKLDFGAVDVVRDDNDQFYIIDVNKTPSWGPKRYPEPEIFEFLMKAL